MQAWKYLNYYRIEKFNLMIVPYLSQYHFLFKYLFELSHF